MKPIIVGAGLAGLTTALSLAPLPVVLLSPRKLGEECASAWAQGGIAAAVGTDDTPQLHAEDTATAGAGICDPAVTKAVTKDGSRVIGFLAEHGVAFDRNESGLLHLALEGAHRRRRVVHAADQTGATIINALIKSARTTPSIEIIEGASAVELLTHDGRISGLVIEHNGAASILPTGQVVLATGGAGALWKETSNPLGSWGRGLALAARIGAVLGDLEFMQFHPTAIDIGRDPMPLASEALRGEGCTLINSKGERFVEELQPRDIVARAIWGQKAAGEKVFLDGRKALGAHFAEHFPLIHASCLSAGIDPATMPIPVSPAAHYHMGGIVTDLYGRTSVEGLWACGEVACTGLHGANRLASNSLLEATSFGRRVAEDITGIRGQKPQAVDTEASIPQTDTPESTAMVRTIMSRHVGVLRDKAGLEKACDELAPLAACSGMALAGLMIAASALRREESRGSHTRTDFPAASAAWQKRQTITIADLQPWLDTEQRMTAGE